MKFLHLLGKVFSVTPNSWKPFAKNVIKRKDKQMKKKDDPAKKLRVQLLNTIIEFSLASLKDKEDFTVGMASMIDTLVGFLSSTLVSACTTLDMDREKFILYVNQVANEIKQESQRLFNETNKNSPR